MFGVLAVAGDLGCSVGPWLTGMVSAAVENNSTLLNVCKNYGFTAQQASIKLGLLVAVIFPIITIICFSIPKKSRKDELL